MQLTMLVVPSGRGQRPLCVHTGITEVLGGSSFVVVGGGRRLFLSQVWFQRRLRHKHTLSKTICNQAVSVLVPPFFFFVRHSSIAV